MNKLSYKIIALLFGGIALLVAGVEFGLGQVRTVRVYNPSIYNRTRRLTSNRAAVRKTVRKVVKKRSVQVKKKRRPKQR